MVRALVFCVFCIFALVGMRSFFDKINNKLFFRSKSSATVLLNLKEDGENAELVIRNASNEIRRLCFPFKVSLCVVNNSLDNEIYEVCEKTVSKLSDAFVANENVQIKNVI